MKDASFICVYDVPFARYSELFVEYRKKNLSDVYLAPSLRVTPLQFHHRLWRQKTRNPIVRRCLRGDMFCRFDRTPTCDRRADRRTQGHRI